MIDLNLVKLDSTLENKILCKKLIEQNNLIAVYTHNANDFNSKKELFYLITYSIHKSKKTVVYQIIYPVMQIDIFIIE